MSSFYVIECKQIKSDHHIGLMRPLEYIPDFFPLYMPDVNLRHEVIDLFITVVQDS